MIEEFLNMTRWASEDKFSFVKGKSNYRVHTLNLKGLRLAHLLVLSGINSVVAGLENEARGGCWGWGWGLQPRRRSWLIKRNLGEDERCFWDVELGSVCPGGLSISLGQGFLKDPLAARDYGYVYSLYEVCTRYS